MRYATEKGETGIGPEEDCYPSGSITAGRKGRARFPDGRVRVVLLGIPDTWFSIPARAKWNGRTVTGCVMVDDGANLGVALPAEEFRFYPSH